MQWFREQLGDLPYRIHKPEGAIFLWLWFEGLLITSQDLYQRLKQRGVHAVKHIPGYHGICDTSLGRGTVDAKGVYEVDVRIEAESGIDPQVKSVLNMVAARTSVNKYRIEQKGRLPAQMTRQLFR